MHVRLSRRQFLGRATGAAGLLALEPPPMPAAADAVLVCMPAACRFAESAAGYRAALGRLGIGFAEAPPEQVPPAKLMILPAFVCPGTDLCSRLRKWLDRGSTVLFESAGGFSSMASFRRDREWMRRDFALELEAPVNLWAGDRPRTPYISYSWPIETRVRDFSRVVPVGAGPGLTIARTEGLTVGVRRQVGKRSLVFLGSPLGPGLWVGEREALRWFAALCREAKSASRFRSQVTPGEVK